jgi:hypothetical protein
VADRSALIPFTTPHNRGLRISAFCRGLQKAEFEHNVIRKRTLAGLKVKAVRARGRVGGRPRTWRAASGSASARFNANGLLETITAASVTTFCAPPTVWRILVTHQIADYKTKLREVVSAGEPHNPEIIDHVQGRMGAHGRRK